jgi:rRNA-processing protein FCF1
VDDEIASAALGMGAKVATTDVRLARSLRSLHVGVITLRSGRVSVP